MEHDRKKQAYNNELDYNSGSKNKKKSAGDEKINS